MDSKWEQAGELWPGIIAVKPFTTTYEAIYREKNKQFPSYKEAEDWILEQKRREMKPSSYF